MLTKTDLSKIRKLVREEVEAEGENIRTEVNGEIKLAGIRTTTELQSVNNRLKNLEISSAKMGKDIQILKTDVKKVQKDLNKTSNFLDKENLQTVKRVRVIEEHLDFPEPAVI